MTYLRHAPDERLRRTVEADSLDEPIVAADDWRRSAEVFADLADPDVMDAAWR